jgi:hypothetical protein
MILLSPGVTIQAGRCGEQPGLAILFAFLPALIQSWQANKFSLPMVSPFVPAQSIIFILSPILFSERNFFASPCLTHKKVHQYGRSVQMQI